MTMTPWVAPIGAQTEPYYEESFRFSLYYDVLSGVSTVFDCEIVTTCLKAAPKEVRLSSALALARRQGHLPLPGLLQGY